MREHTRYTDDKAAVGLMTFSTYSHSLTVFSAAPQYVVETKFVGEQAVPGAPTEVVGNESNIVDEHIKQAPAGDRTVVVENVDVPGSEVCILCCAVLLCAAVCMLSYNVLQWPQQCCMLCWSGVLPSKLCE
jgi:hypothetical protein